MEWIDHILPLFTPSQRRKSEQDSTAGFVDPDAGADDDL